MQSRHVSLIITTYNRPEALNLVLESVKRQTVIPDEVIVADDGSTHETLDLIIESARTFPTKIIHAWQEDEGYRLSRSKNNAVAQANGDYLIFLDGDLITHPRFVESHLSFAKPGRLLSGGRVMLSPRYTAKLVERQKLPRMVSAFVSSENRHNFFDSAFLSKVFTYKSNTEENMKGGNSSMFKSDYYMLNGYDENFVGWGYEDSEFAVRAMRAGMTKWKLRFSAVTYHLDHGEDNRKKSGVRVARNLQMLNAIRSSRAIRCVHGLSHHLPSPESQRYAHDKEEERFTKL